jgi:hypothetical protein
MSDYLLMVHEDERAHAAQAPKAIAELIVQRAQFAEDLRRAGQLRDSGRFRPSREGKRVRRRGDDHRVDDGPFPGDHGLAAYYWVDAQSLDDAAALASRIPALASDQVDVRPLLKGGVRADKEAKPGKVFAFAVLGNASSEEAWAQVMDRIDAETRDAFPASAALGGNRLQPPSAGRRVATQGDRRAMFDGPFLESKEVIGGVFFLRMMTMDDAVRWAAQSRFVVHGALEIRELWRS